MYRMKCLNEYDTTDYHYKNGIVKYLFKFGVKVIIPIKNICFLMHVEEIDRIIREVQV